MYGTAVSMPPQNRTKVLGCIMTNTVQRESNCELLRLIGMFFILFLHVFGAALGIVGKSIPGTIFECLFIVAVNCFVLISGYFGIKVSYKSFLRLYITIFTYTFGFAVLSALYHQSLDIKRIGLSFLSFSHSPYWFTNVYFSLYFLSPLLNLFIERINRCEFIVTLVILTFVSFILGFFSKGDINLTGYNAMNFIFLYFIGRFIRIYIKDNTLMKNKITYFSIYIVCSLIIAVLLLLTTKLGISGIYVLGLNSLNYNSPLVVIASVALFMFFRSIKIQSKIINWLSVSSLSIFLIHGNPSVYKHYQDLFKYINIHYGQKWYIVGLYSACVLLIMLCCIFIDKVRMIITNPIEKLLLKIKVEYLINEGINKIYKTARNATEGVALRC
jgi:surface polysaccharide O-acyltransferase-like enzyme